MANATSAMNTSNMAAMLIMSFTPVVVPAEMASRRLLLGRPWFSMEAIRSVAGSVCGQRILAMTIDPGAAITDAESKCVANKTFAAGSEPPSIPI